MNHNTDSSIKSDYYGLMAEFNSPEALLEKVKQVREAGYREIDAFTPFPVHGLPEAIGVSRNWVPYIVLLGAILGGAGAYFMQYFSAVIAYPLNVAGRPLHSWPAFMVITFEGAVLVAAVFGVLGMLALNKLPMPHHPVFGVPRFELASHERFYLCIKVTDAQFDLEQTRTFLEGLEPESVSLVEQSGTKIYD